MDQILRKGKVVATSVDPAEMATQKDLTAKVNKYGAQININTEVDDATLWETLAQIGAGDEKTESSVVFNAGSCYLDYRVAPNRIASIFHFLVTGGVAAGAYNKKITLVKPATGEVFTKDTEEGVWQAWKGGYRYMHTLTRYNNDAMQFPVGWFAIINEKKTMSFSDITSWLYSNGYTSPETSYGYLQGGCCGTTAVRNSADTGTSYVGRVMSGVYSTSGTDLNFKWDYNGTTTNIQSARCRITSIQL